MKSKIAKSVLAGATLALIPSVILAAYVVSVIWRVSIAEQEVFGRSDLIPLCQKADFDEAPVPPYWGQPTYTILHDGKKIVVFLANSQRSKA